MACYCQSAGACFDDLLFRNDFLPICVLLCVIVSRGVVPLVALSKRFLLVNRFASSQRGNLPFSIQLLPTSIFVAFCGAACYKRQVSFAMVFGCRLCQ